MRTFTNEDLIRHAFGCSEPELSHMLEEAAAEDDELGSQLLFLRRYAGVEGEEPTLARPAAGSVRVRAKNWRTVRRAAAIFLLLLCTGSAAWAGWRWGMPQPLLFDDFEDGWGDAQKWSTPRRFVHEEKGYVRLVDRGFLATVQQFKPPYRLKLKWKWIDLQGDFLYRDSLDIVLRTSATPAPSKPWPATDGVRVCFNATGGQVGIALFNGCGPIAETPRSTLPLPAGEWLTIIIVDDGASISVSCDSPHLRPEQRNAPLLTAAVAGDFKHGKIAFYNRERLAEASFESWLDDVEVWPMQP